MVEALSRDFFLTFANSALQKKATSHFKMQGPHSFARWFIGGETIKEVLVTIDELGRQGFKHTLIHLGKHVASTNGARLATSSHLETIEEVDPGVCDAPPSDDRNGISTRRRPRLGEG